MNPYTILGIDQLADRKAIRAAYRRLSKTCHPDSGGDPVAFAQLKLAQDILIDPDRRARFDATGDVSETTPDNSTVEALAWIAVAMERVASQYAQRIERIDFVSALKVDLQSQLQAQQQDRSKILATKAIWTLAVARFKSKRDRPNYLASICISKIAALDQHLQQIQQREQSITAALKLLNDSSYTWEKSTTYPTNTATSSTSSSFINIFSLRMGNF